jgi:hypothetical protein
MTTAYLSANAGEGERKAFFRKLVVLIDEVTLTRRAITVDFATETLLIERHELPDDFDDYDDTED